MGIPTALVELGYPSEEWIAKKKKRNTIKVIFIQGSQMIYQGGGEKMIRLDKSGKSLEISEHVKYIKSIPIKKRSEWVLVFRTPHDLHTFIDIVEHVTIPEAPINRDQPIMPSLRSDSLERRNREYLKKLGIDVGRSDGEDFDLKTADDKDKEERISEQEARAKNIQKLKDKVFRQQL